MSGQLAPEYRRDYILGGNATVTLVSKRTGDRFTFRVSESKPRVGEPAGKKPVHFVNVLTGPDNRRDYSFLGTIFPDGGYRRSMKSQIGPDAPSAKAWEWTWNNLDADQVEVWHEGSCSRCGRALTDPASIERGLGPVCAERSMG
jgi:hypothetical protein